MTLGNFDRRTIAPITLVTLLLLGCGVACAQSPAPPQIETDLDQLRTRFNAQSDHVRAILLASPT